MPSRLLSSQDSVEELIAQIFINCTITYTEQLLLQYVLLTEETLDEQLQTLIKRIFYGVRHGLLQVVE
jgi:tRNA(Ile)-lysidine synthase TilS/MesJ